MEDKEFLSFKDIMDKLSIARSTIDRWEKEGNFPRRIKISANKVRWKSTEISEWLRNKVKER
jgi:prophage regulatory protein